MFFAMKSFFDVADEYWDELETDLADPALIFGFLKEAGILAYERWVDIEIFY